MTRERDFPAWIERGAAVAYYPHGDAGPFHVGFVDGLPRKCGGTWVVPLRDMDPTYREAQRRTVPAAACASLKPYDLTAEYARRRAEEVRLWAIDRREAILRQGLDAVLSSVRTLVSNGDWDCGEEVEGAIVEIESLADEALKAAAALSEAVAR